MTNNESRRVPIWGVIALLIIAGVVASVFAVNPGSVGSLVSFLVLFGLLAMGVVLFLLFLGR